MIKIENEFKKSYKMKSLYFFLKTFNTLNTITMTMILLFFLNMYTYTLSFILFWSSSL